MISKDSYSIPNIGNFAVNGLESGGLIYRNLL